MYNRYIYILLCVKIMFNKSLDINNILKCSIDFLLMIEYIIKVLNIMVITWYNSMNDLILLSNY